MENETQILNSRYRLLELVGEGRTTVVHKALDLQLRRTVAVKILHPDLSTDAAFLSRFRNEARAAANILHPNIVAMHDFGTDGQTQYMVMEYVPGQDLKRKMQEQNPLGVEQALMLAIQICGGIGYAHRAGLVHADVKPQNILVTPEDIVKVSDFGINQALTDTQPSHRASIILGSPEYYSPEQVRGERPTPTSDVYAIGIIMFEMLAGRLPYIAANQQEMALAHIRAPIPLLSDLNPQVPEALARLVYRAMSKEPNERYTTADQLGNLLQVVREGKELPTDSVRVAKPPVVQGIPPYRRRPTHPHSIPPLRNRLLCIDRTISRTPMRHCLQRPKLQTRQARRKS